MPKTTQDALWDEYLTTQQPEVRDRLLLKYLPLVKYVAGKIMANLPSSVSYDDLVSAGVIGLIGALDRFNPELGVKFETFVLPRIRGAILDELRKLDWAPRSLRTKARRLERTVTELERELGRSVSDGEVAEKLHLGPDEFISFLREVNSTSLVSLDVVGSEDQERVISMYDVLENPFADNPLKDIEKQEIKKLLVKSIEQLPEQEKIVMALYYYEELTLREIGQVLNITESRVSQIHSKAVETLRTLLAGELLS